MFFELFTELNFTIVSGVEMKRVGDVSKEIKRVRAQMEENEQLAILMKGLRGQNLKDSQFADNSIKLRLVEVTFPTCKVVVKLSICFSFATYGCDFLMPSLHVLS